ncbi:MAG: hypothetical protein KDB31_04240 [Microthrixaceae bacterium]|nr:hypothetical protein [Microthrixaceae bacterium]
MSSQTVERPVEPSERPEGPDGQRPRRRIWRNLLIVAAALLGLLVVLVAWFLLARDRAEQLTQDDALEDFRAATSADTSADGRPAPGVYPAAASGSESIGLPGFDEELGANAPVTVTYGDSGCYTYRADFNSHHWRSWTFCPTDTATFALVELQSWTARKAPALDVETLSTYSCAVPLDFLWDGMAPGETRSSECTGTLDTDDSVTGDVGTVEVVGTETVTIDGTVVEGVRIRTSDEFSEAQTGFERGDWLLHPDNGLPLSVGIEAELAGGPTTYTENFQLDLGGLTPAT